MRVKGGTVTRRRHKRVLKKTEGFKGRRSRTFKGAKLALQKSQQHATKDRRRKKRDFRQLWITRINAAARLNGLSYSKLIVGLRKANILVDRKILAQLAASDPRAFAAIAEKARAAVA